MTESRRIPFKPIDHIELEYNPLKRMIYRLPHWKILLRRAVLACLILFACLNVYVVALRFLPAPNTPNMVGTALTGTAVKRKPVPLSKISPNLVRAVIAAEDSRFCEHPGIDLNAIQSALEFNRKNEQRRGGSTISQQTAKNVFFWNGGGYARKAGEAWMTLVAETAWGKRRIMEHYLNVAEWGDGIYGAEAAAQARFGKSAMDLSVREAALLAAVLPNPNKWRLDPAGPYVSGRASTISQRMGVVKRDGLDRCVLT